MAKTLFLIVMTFLIFSASGHPVLAAWPSVADSSALPKFRQLNEDERVITLKAVLDSYGSPLADEAGNFIFYADKHQLDWKLVAAIAGAESTFGKHIPYGSYNAWGWAVYTGKQKGAVFASWENGIAEVSKGLRENYLNDDLATPEQIGRRYASSRAWPNSVRFFITKIDEFTPASVRTLPVEL